MVLRVLLREKRGGGGCNQEKILEGYEVGRYVGDGTYAEEEWSVMKFNLQWNVSSGCGDIEGSVF